MQWQPLAPYFIIKMPKKDQKERREKLGRFYLSPNHIFMKREIQSGEIVAIGEDAHEGFPESKIGDTLLCHHFISGKEAEGSDEGRYHIDSDEMFNYYAVTCFSFEGRRNETYGIWDGEKIIPHPEFIFLEGDKPKETVSPDKFIDTKLQKNGSLLVFKNWEETREEKGDRMQQIKFQNQELARTTKFDENGKEYMPDEVKKKIEENEREMDAISKDVNKKKYVPFKVEWGSKTLSEEFGEPVEKGDIVYALNQAAQTQIEFNNVSYRVVKINYISCTERWIKHSLQKYQSLSSI
jgi:hypothetical protein